MGRKLKLTDVAIQIGVPYSTLARWVEQGLVKPPGYRNQHGAPVRLTQKNRRELYVLARLRGLLSLQELKKAMCYLREELKHNPLSTGRFFVIGGAPKHRRLVKVCNTGEAIEIVSSNEAQLLIPLAVHGLEQV